ncbi:MAG: T9SS type A sorting domain-containing protein [Bacteroidia bacterium]|nr:T9SS type A sorting domain-containing protein [Bacteroidia bacterium]
MKKLLLSIFTFVIINSASAQWITQTYTTNNLYSVFAIDANNVCATGFTGPIRTSNAGTNWAQNLILGGVNTFEVHTKNPFRFYIMCQNSNWFMRLNVGGGSTLSGGRPDSILSLHFRDMACVFAVGTAGKIETSCDTGVTWQLRSSGTTQNLNAIWFSDLDSGCVVGNAGVIRRTKDAGNTWTTVTSGVATNLNAIHFPSPTVGYIAGTGGRVLKSMDAGATWTNMPTGVLNGLNGIYFVDQDTGYVVGTGGLIMKTINGGVNWNPMASGTSQILNSVHFASPVDGWAVGNAGTILKYNGSAGLGINSTNAITDFNFYPNPTKDFIIINSTVNTASIKLFNALGELVYEGLTDSETKIDISNFSAGIYFAEWRTGDKVVVKKFVKE